MAAGADIDWYDSDGVTPLPAEKVLPLILAGAPDTPRKLGIRSIGTAPTGALRVAIDQEGTSDGYLMLRRGLDGGGSIGDPPGLSAVVGSAGAGGTWAGVGTKAWVVTALTALGESAGGVAVTAQVLDATSKVTVSWTAVAGATGYRVYRTDSPGSFPVNSLVGTISGGGVVTFLDGGAAASPGSPPVANTTGGGPPGYGTPPTMGTAPVITPALPPGAWAYIWVSRVTPPEASAITNPRRAALVVTEV
jgi:hypothetical protein